MAHKAIENLGRFLLETRNDPYRWVIESYPWGEGALANETGPDEWQAEQLREIGEKLRAGAGEDCIIREATASGHGIGKSALVAWIILWGVSTFEDTRGVVTANTEKQLSTKTWVELSKWFHLCPYLDLMFECQSSGIKSRSPGHKDWRIDCSPWSLRNTEAFAGLHNKGKRIILIYDEASAIPDRIWEVSEGALTDTGTQIIWCVYGNPTRNTGRFKECFTGEIAKRWSQRQIDSRDSSFSNKEQIQEWIDDYGIDSDFVKVRVRGMFPNLSSRQFIALADAEAAYGRHLREEQYSFAPKILTCDPAWEGDDELVIGLRQGLAFKILRIIPKNDNDLQIAEIIANLEDQEHADAVFVDAGYGTGIVSAGRSMKRNWKLVWFAGESSDPGYLNKRAQMWGLMRDWLKEGGAIPKDPKLFNDLIAPETVGRVDGKIQLESKADMKKRDLKSPNRADCLALTFAYPVSQKGSRGTKLNFAISEQNPRGIDPRRGVSHTTDALDYDPYADMDRID